jgi:hypothetical protein
MLILKHDGGSSRDARTQGDESLQEEDGKTVKNGEDL